MKGGLLQLHWLKRCTKWFGINNHDGPFSILLRIGHMTGGSVIWPIWPLLHKGKKQVILRCGWFFLALLKLIKLHTCLQGFPNTWGWEEYPPPPNIIFPFKFSFRYVDMSRYRLLPPLVPSCFPISYTRCPPQWGGAVLPPPLRWLWETLIVLAIKTHY